MKTLLTLLLLTFSISVTAQQEKLIGSWTGEDQGEVGSVIFEADGYCAFVIGGQKLGGKEFDMDGVKGSMTYTLDDSSKPLKITMTMTEIVSGDSSNIYGLIRFLDNETIEFALGSPGVPIYEFTKENSIKLTKD